jgi:hypothetical protein
MSHESQLTPEAASFCRQLAAVRVASEAQQAEAKQLQKIQVAGVGQAISAAYEQLRIAAENTEEHLLLQRAIRRFYTRNVSFHARKAPKPSGEELLVELTQSGYLKNGTIASSVPERIDELLQNQHALFWKLRDHKITHKVASGWVLDGLSVETEALLGGDHSAQNVLVRFATHHYGEMLKADAIAAEKDFELSLYVATHKALLRSDIAMVRRTIVSLYQQTPEDMNAFIRLNETVDRVFLSDLTAKLTRVASKYGAPWRVLKGMLADQSAVDDLLPVKEKFMSAYETQSQKEYDYTTRRLNRGVIKSVVFLFITKVIVGLAVEVPYDIVVYGSVAMLPLLINILFPPVYMASLRWSLTMPGSANIEATSKYAQQLLYGEGVMPKHIIRLKSRSSIVLNVLFAAMFFVSFGVVVTILASLGFNIMQGFIFFLFISTASFLGFRLSRLVREYEMFTARQNFFDAVRDFIYTPFVIVGRWLSDKYSKVNIVTLVLDMAIELPLKTFLRLIRQWTRFLNEKRDEI